MSTQVRIIVALWFLALVNYLDRVAMSFAGPAIMKSLAMSPAEFGIVLSSFGIGYLLAQIPGGLLADKVGARALLIGGPVLWALFTGLTGLVSALAGFVAVRVCFGLSEGVSNSSLYKIVGENFDGKQRARALAICSTAIPLAPAFAGPVIGKLLGAFGWQAMFMMMAFPALLAALGCYLLLPRGNQAVLAQVATSPLPIADIIHRPSLWTLSLAAFAWNIAYWGYIGWMPSFLALARHIDLKAIGPLGGIPYVFAFFGMLIGGWLGSGILHQRCAQLVMVLFVGAGASLFVAYRAESLAASLVGLSAAAFFLFGTQGPIGKVALDLAPERHRATYVGIYNTAGQFGGAVAPVTIGFLVSRTGSFGGGFDFMIGALCLATVCFFVLGRHGSSGRAAAVSLT